jgi:hypothetical protein
MFNQIFEVHSHTIYILLDNDDKTNLLKELLAMAREARQEKQAERVEQLQECGIKLQNCRAQIYVPNPSPEDMHVHQLNFWMNLCSIQMLIRMQQKQRQRNSLMN